MQINKLNYGMLKYLLVGFLTISTPALALDLNATHKEINFLTVALPTCGEESENIPALPEDPRADLYYKVAMKILGQNDTDHYKQMFILADKSAEMGHWNAKLLMASLYLKNSNSYYTEYDPKKARMYIDKLLQKNVPGAFYAMGQYKLNGMPEFRNAPIPASVYLFEAARLNNPDALSDMYDIFVSVGRIKDANALLDCAVKQKQGTASALMKKANVLEGEASTEAELIGSFKYLYEATKAGNYNAIASFPNKENYYKQQYGKTFFDKEFLERMSIFQNAKNSIYIHRDPIRKAQGRNDEVKGNASLTFPNLEKVLPFPPDELPDWDRNIRVVLSEDDLKFYDTDYDYDELAKEAAAIKIEKPIVPETAEPKK
ncbi:sel1 repeat family protein [Entomomonas asaccharolytica]|uniref:Sel1 repeat family protein n=1 Tax=Entomomonas asaccharolytica TaxID=2785331 RepID=A0A974ND58_9GAMM|nr:sel1 repeat family protein [Entomomonas asaccharolytica]QQP84511.1 sel1 repeat family protein [Entomomonas asaccharolytica]